MNKFLLCFFLCFLCSQLALARNVYFFEAQVSDVSIQVSTKFNDKRNVYFFDDKDVNRKTVFKVPAGYSIESKSLGLGSGYRKGDLEWNTGFPNNSALPNILSELEWSNIDIIQFSFDGDVKLRNKLRLGLDLGFGVISGGSGQDSDFELDNRQGEFSRSTFSVGGDDTIDASAYIGYEFPVQLFEDKRTFFTPLLGYSYYEQNIQFEDAVQVISGTAFGITLPPPGPFSGLDSEYKTNWYGPWLGFEFKYESSNWALITDYSHHWADFDAQGRWNLRGDLAQPISFIQETEGEGDRASLMLIREWQNDWHAYLNLGMERWKTEPGHQNSISFTGANIGGNGFRLNKVKWDSWWVGIGMKRYF